MSQALVRRVAPSERDRLRAVLIEHWGSPLMARRGELVDVAAQDCLVAADEAGRWLGVAAWRIDGAACELVLIEAFETGHGTGTALLDAVVARAREAGARRLWLVTTNDNVDALRFYQRRGLRLVALRPDAVTRSRETLKPEIPLLGEYGIPLRDELELELPLD